MSASVRILILVPYGIQESGLVIFASRLERELLRLGVFVTIVIRGARVEWQGRKIQGFDTSAELIDWIRENIGNYDVFFWAGFCHEAEEITRQLEISNFILDNPFKKVFFLWERTGVTGVIREDEVLRILFQSPITGIIALNAEHVVQIERIFGTCLHTYQLSPGVDTKEYIPVASFHNKLSIRKDLHLPASAVIAIAVGRFTQRKRFDFLIRTWAECQTHDQGALLLIIGKGFPVEDSIADIVYDLARVTKNVRIVEYRDDMDRSIYYRAADFLVLSGILEGEPSVLSEAMASGLPVVASNIAGHCTLVRDGVTGLLFEPESKEALNKALYQMIVDSRAREKMGRAARELSIRERDISVVASRFLDVFSRA